MVGKSISEVVPEPIATQHHGFMEEFLANGNIEVRVRGGGHYGCAVHEAHGTFKLLFGGSMIQASSA
jgi:hypothetical protein